MRRIIVLILLAASMTLLTAGGGLFSGDARLTNLLPETLAAPIEAFTARYGRWLSFAAFAGLFGVFAMLVVRRWRKRSAAGVTSGELGLAETTRAPKNLAWVVVFLFFGVGGMWAVQAPLSAAAIAPGVISPEGRRITVRHLEGGTVAELLVQEGQFVRQGDRLAILGNVTPRATTQALEIDQVALKIEEAIWVAEETGQAEFSVPTDVLADTRPETQERIEAARTLLAQRIEARAARERLLAGRGEEFARLP